MIAYRQLTDSDAAAMQEVWDSCGSPFRLPASDGLTGWAACMDEKPIGFTLADNGEGVLVATAILPDHRGKGIARELMRQAEAWLFSHGWKEIRLNMGDGGALRSIGFYERLGWVLTESDGGRCGLKKANARPVYQLEEHTVADPATGYTRLVRLLRGPGDQPHPLCLFLDGEHYWRDMYAVPMLEKLVRTGAMPLVTFAFLGHVSARARHEDYTCNERYAQYVGGRLLDWLGAEIPGLRRGGHLVAGLSLSGLMATYLTLQYPEHFAGCLSQSGSHWWNYEWFAEMVRQRSAVAARFWLSVGDQETQTDVKHPPTGLFQKLSQVDGVERAGRLLEQIGGTIHTHRFHGGHSPSRWYEELDEALPWLHGGQYAAC